MKRAPVYLVDHPVYQVCKNRMQDTHKRSDSIIDLIDKQLVLVEERKKRKRLDL